MSTFKKCILSFSLVLLSTSLMAQKSKKMIGGNIVFGLPNGDFKNSYKSATGVEGSAGIGISKVYFLGTVGYTLYKPVSGNLYGKITIIPLKAGLRIYATKHLFLAGNAGYGFLKDEVMESREARFVYDAGVGVHFLLGQLSVHYDAWKRKNNPGTSATVQLKLGLALR